jgi:hypothetical protein
MEDERDGEMKEEEKKIELGGRGGLYRLEIYCEEGACLPIWEGTMGDNETHPIVHCHMKRDRSPATLIPWPVTCDAVT